MVEFKYILKKLTITIIQRYRVARISYNYFTTTKGVYNNYKKNTKKSIRGNRNKINAIFKVLEDNLLICRSGNNYNNSVDFKLGLKNIYYIPDDGIW